jgi:predicted DNA-binding WGR domain protein
MLRAMNGAISSLADPIELVAIDAARNIRRRYSIMVSVDLFGLIVVEMRWGRIGAKGQSKRLSFDR